MSFLEGFLLGLATVIFFGPVFFTLLNGTLQYGQRAGFMVTFGIITSDIACVLLCLLAAPLVTHATSQFWMTVVGSFILFGMGIKYLFVPIKYTAAEIKLNTKHYLGFYTKGFIVNFTSPFTFGYWLGSATYAEGRFPQTNHLVIFISAILLGILSIDIIKVILAKQLKRLVQPKALKIISVGCGIILIGFGIRLIWYLF